MSLLLVLAPIALGGGASAVTISAATAVAGIFGTKAVLGVAAEANLQHLEHLKELYARAKSGVLPPFETVFCDTDILLRTLTEHGLQVSKLSNDYLICQIGSIKIEYTRKTEDGAFWATVSGIQDIDEFLAEFQCFESEYRQNVQTDTYNSLIENLQNSSMHIANEEILDDNSIVLTIDVMG